MEKTKKFIMKLIIGIVIGIVLHMLDFTNSWPACFLVGTIVTFGWSLSGRIICVWSTGQLGIILFAVRLILSVLIGWIALPVEFIILIIKLSRKRSESSQV